VLPIRGKEEETPSNGYPVFDPSRVKAKWTFKRSHHGFAGAAATAPPGRLVHGTLFLTP